MPTNLPDYIRFGLVFTQPFEICRMPQNRVVECPRGINCSIDLLISGVWVVHMLKAASTRTYTSKHYAPNGGGIEDVASERVPTSVKYRVPHGWWCLSYDHALDSWLRFGLK